MQNIKELRDELASSIDLLKSKKIDRNNAKEIANLAGKIIGSVTIELKYQIQQGTKKKIDFLEY